MGEVLSSWNGDGVFVRGDDPHNSSKSMALFQDKYSTIDETITGTSGDDLILWSGSPSYGSDFIDGGNGKDVISINDYSDNFTIKSQSSGLTYFNDNRGLSYDQYGHAVLSNVEQIEFLDKTVNIGNSSGSDNEVEWNDIYGTRRADELTGTKSADYIDGGKGDDFIYGGAGDDLIVGGKGLDIIEGGEGEDWFATDKKLGRGKNNFDVITDFEVGVDVLMVMGNTKGLWIDNYEGDALLVRGRKDVIAWIDGAGGQLEWGGSDGNLIM